MQLFRTLLQLAFLDAEQGVPDHATRVLSGSTEAAWRHALDDLGNHRLTPMVAYSIRAHGLEDAVPADYMAQLTESYRRTLLANTIQAQMLGALLREFKSRDIEPIVMKGLILASMVYPDLGVRPMVDVDLLVDDSEADRAEEMLRSFGYDRTESWRSFHHESNGLAVDLHTEFPLFPCAMRDELTEHRRLALESVVEVRTWEPNAMLTHLVVHLAKHMNGIGGSLLWIMDIVLLVHSVADRLSIERLRQLGGERDVPGLLWQVLRLARDECGVQPPACFAREVERSRALSLPWILRQRRLQRWGFPRRRFYQRLAARVLRVRPLGHMYWPRWTDVPNGWIDLAIDRRTTR